MKLTITILTALLATSCMKIKLSPFDLSSDKGILTAVAPVMVPITVSYAGNPFTLTQGLPIATISPTTTGVIESCTSNPSLPDGLVIDQNTCAISGTPTVDQASVLYSIVASNPNGSITATISIAVTSSAPANLVYSGSPYTMTQGLTIATLTPTLSGTATSCNSSPTLPTGLALDNISCAISGTPSVAQAATNYTITATNPYGSTQAAISIAVTSSAPSNVVYSGSPFDMIEGVAFPLVIPTNSLKITSCASSPALPAGLTLGTDCRITGTPTTFQTAGNYTITASNSYGSTQTTISISISIPSTFVYLSGSSSIDVIAVNGSSGKMLKSGSTSQGFSNINVDPTGRFAYGVLSGVNKVFMFTINPVSGALTANSPSFIAAGTTPDSVAMDFGGRFVFVTNRGSNTVSSYTINQTNGLLTLVGNYTTGTAPKALVVDPSGRFVYVCNYTGNTISMFSITSATGALVSIAPDIATGTSPVSITTDPTGRFLYAVSLSQNKVSIYTIDPAAGALTAIGTVATGVSPDTIVTDPTGRFAYVNNTFDKTISTYTINPTTGALTAGSVATLSLSPVNLSMDPSGRFLYAFVDGLQSFSINQTDGSLTVNPNYSIIAMTGVGDMGVTRRRSRFAYVANETDSTVSMYSVNSSTGAFTTLGTIASGATPKKVVVEPLGRFAYTVNNTANTVSM